MIAVGYSRVSTAEQAVEGISLDGVQAPHILRACLARGWELAEVYSDPGFSGAEWARRSGLQRLLRRLAEPHPPDALVVYRLDRLSRRVRDIYQLLDLCERSGVAFVSVCEPQFDTTTAIGRAMLGVAALFAQFTRDTIVENVTDAMQAIAAAGRWKGGPVPFGYAYEHGDGKGQTGRLVPHSIEAPLVRLAFHLYVEERLGMRPITERLAAASGRRLTTREVGRMLDRRTYEGLVPHNGKLYPGQHEAILDPALAARARELRGLRRRLFPHGERVQYLLSGLLRCRRCGGPMTGAVGSQKGGPNVRLYRCSRAANAFGENGRRCPGSYIRAERAQQFLVAALRTLAKAGADTGPIVDPPALALDVPESEHVRRQIEAIPARRQRLVGYASRGTITESDLAAALAGLEAEAEQLARSLEELRRPPKVNRRQVRRLYRDVADLLESPEVESQRKRDLLLGTFAVLVVEPNGDVRFRLAHQPE